MSRETFFQPITMFTETPDDTQRFIEQAKDISRLMSLSLDMAIQTIMDYNDPDETRPPIMTKFEMYDVILGCKQIAEMMRNAAQEQIDRQNHRIERQRKGGIQ